MHQICTSGFLFGFAKGIYHFFLNMCHFAADELVSLFLRKSKYIMNYILMITFGTMNVLQCQTQKKKKELDYVGCEKML